MHKIIADSNIHLYHDDLPDELANGIKTGGIKTGGIKTGSVAIDTETMGLNPHRDRLCLVQLCFGDDVAHLVKINDTNKPAPRLKALLEDNKIEKIFHFARFDLAALAQGIAPVQGPVYCTKIASRLTRTYTDRHGLKDLVQEILGIEVSKQQQSSDWGAQELTQEQLRYAASDVLYLHRLQDELNKKLSREDRMETAQACFDFLKTRAAMDLGGFDEIDIFAHS